MPAQQKEHKMNTQTTIEQRPTMLSVYGLWKVFGATEQEFQAVNGSALSDEQIASRGWTAAVKDVTLDIKEGEIFVIMGLSGSGKSTLIRSMTRLNDLTSGKLVVAGQDVTKATDKMLQGLRRKSLGMVFQHFALLPNRTVRDNISFPLEIQGIPKHEYEQKVKDLIETVGLKGREEHFPNELSGGQQQRVGIARSLANDPKVWVLDEPFSALDPLIRTDLQDEVLRLQQTLHKTVIFITHDLDEAIKIADRIAIMENGRIVQVGTPEQLVAQPANDYVKRFVSKVPLSKVTRLRNIMQPLQSDCMSNLKLDMDAIVETVAPVVIEQNTDIIVTDQSQPVGQVAIADFIKVLAGGAR